jgi:hypothetical protein
LKAEDVKIGDRVVPFQKTVGEEYLEFSEWLKLVSGERFKKDGFAVVTHILGCVFYLNHFGSFFASDFEPYIEPTKFPTTPKRKFRGYVLGNEVVVHFGGKTGKAKYNPEDEKLGLPFSINKGVGIALRRTLGEDVQDIEIVVNPQHKAQDKPTFEVGETVRAIAPAMGKTGMHLIGRIGTVEKFSTSGKPLVFGYVYDFDALEKVPQPAKFVPHLDSEYGNIGECTKMVDAIKRPLFVGDTVDLYSGTELVREHIIVAGHGKHFVMGIESACNNDGTISLNYQIIKKRSHSDIKNGEVIDGVKYEISHE